MFAFLFPYKFKRLKMKKYIEIDKSIKELSDEELSKIFGGLKKSVLMRSIIMNEKKFLSVLI